MGCSRQVYLQFRLEGNSVLGLIDSGSDVSLIAKDYLELYHKEYEKQRLGEKVELNIKSFTGNTVKLVGRFCFHLCVGKQRVKANFYVTQPMGYCTKLILGRDILVDLSASILYRELTDKQLEGCDKHQFTLQVGKNYQELIELAHLAVPGLHEVTAVGNYNISGHSSAFVDFQLSYNPFIGARDKILISADSFQNPFTDLFIEETRSSPTFTSAGEIIGKARVQNLSSQALCVKGLKGFLEVLPEGQFQLTELNQRNRKAIVQMLQKTGLAMRIFYMAVDTAVSATAAEVKSLPVEFKNFFSAETCRLVTKHQTSLSEGATIIQPQECRINGGKVCTLKNTSNCYHLATQTEMGTYFSAGQPPEDFALGLLEPNDGPCLAVPEMVDRQVTELVKLEEHEERIRQDIKRIFIDKYPEVVGRHNLDSGQLRYLGKVFLRTIPGMTLPKHRRLYALNSREQTHLSDIIDFLLKYEIIRETFQDSTEQKSMPWGALGHLVSRKTRPGEPNEGQASLARIVVNYRDNLNAIIQPTPSLVTSIETCLEKLRHGYFFSIMDLKQSYFGLTLEPESEGLTQFLVPPGNSYCFRRVPMGLSSAPASLLEKLNVVFNFVPKRDSEGQIIFKPGQNKNEITAEAELISSPLPQVVNFYDDILVWTERVPNDDAEDSKSLEKHFCELEKVVERMALYDIKTSYHKCEFGRREILFLGWLVKDAVIRPDPKRLQKVKDFIFPTTRKEMQSFLGLYNTMRRITPLTAGNYLAPLSSLSSTKEKYQPTDYHRQCFEKLKEQLVGPDLFCSLIDPDADKILFTDASGLAYGSVLLERIPNSETDNKPLQESHISASSTDTIDQVIRKWQLKYVRKEVKGTPEDSFYESIIAVAKNNQMQRVPTQVIDLKSEIVQFLRKDGLGEQLKELVCQGKRSAFLDYLYTNIQAVGAAVTPQSIVLEAVTHLYNRGMIVVLDRLTDDGPPIKEIIRGVHKACTPIKLGYYEAEKRFVPLFDTLDFEFDSRLLNSKFKVCYYDCKLIAKEHRNRTILEHEATSLLLALKKYEAYIKTCRVFVVIDNRSLYYLFSPAIISNHAKVNRFQLKLFTDYPSCRILWCSTKENIADLFTRFGLKEEFESKIKFNDFRITSVPQLPNNCVMTWASWADVVEKHPQCIELLVNLDKTYQTKAKPKLANLKSVYEQTRECQSESGINTILGETHQHSQARTTPRSIPRERQLSSTRQANTPAQSSKTVNVLATSPQSVHHLYVDNLTLLTVPLDSLREKLSFSAVKEAQRIELPELYEKLLGSDLFIKEGNRFFKLIEGVIYTSKVPTGEGKVIYLPKSLEATALAIYHLRLGHQGAKGLSKELSRDYRFESTNFHELCRQFTHNCFHCLINSNQSRRVAMGTLSLTDINEPFSALILDLAEDLYPTIRKHNHLLIVKCLLTSFLIILPLRTKTATEVLFNVATYIIPITGLPRLWISDNGSAFKGTELRSFLMALRTKVLLSPALSPEARGLIERAVGQVKFTLKKLISIQDLKTIQMDVMSTLVSLYYNNTYNERVQNYPAYLAFGRKTLNSDVFTLDLPLKKLHPFLLKNTKLAQKHHSELQQMYSKVKLEIQAAQREYAKAIRKPIDKKIEQGTLVYIKKFEKPQGVKTTLHSTYSPSPYVVITSTHTYAVIQRIADGMLTIRSLNDVKAFRGSEIMESLPTAVKSQLTKNFTNLNQEDIKEIVNNTQLQLFQDQIPDESWQELESSDNPELSVFSFNDNATLADHTSESQTDSQQAEKPAPEQEGDSSDEEIDNVKYLRGRKVYIKPQNDTPTHT